MCSILLSSISTMIIETVLETMMSWHKKRSKLKTWPYSWETKYVAKDLYPHFCISTFHSLIWAEKGPMLFGHWGKSGIIHKRSTVRAYSIMSVLSWDSGLVMPSVYEATWPSAPKLWGFGEQRINFWIQHCFHIALVYKLSPD